MFVNKLRNPESIAASRNTSKSNIRWICRRRRLTGAKMFPFVNDFALFAKFFATAMGLKDVPFTLLDGIGLHIHPEKCYHKAA